jgi:hypothetical protein
MTIKQMMTEQDDFFLLYLLLAEPLLKLNLKSFSWSYRQKQYKGWLNRQCNEKQYEDYAKKANAINQSMSVVRTGRTGHVVCTTRATEIYPKCNPIAEFE